MATIQEYLDVISEEKIRLIEALNDYGATTTPEESLEGVVTKTIEQFASSGVVLDLNDIKSATLANVPTCFETTKKTVNITARGQGKIFVIVENVLYELELDETDKTLTINHNSETNRVYTVVCSDIEALDLHGNKITNFILSPDDKITKLIIYDNNISSFTCPQQSSIQFLHIFNNPICNDSSKLNELFDSLPDRAGKSIGSIVTYPWYGLEKLICIDDNGDYAKYPNTYAFAKLNYVQGALYGLVKEDANGKEYIESYFRCVDAVNKQLELDAEVNMHHTNRKRLEKEYALKKNWVFGSAIIYDEEASKDFPFHMRETGVADVWETAEKGLGMRFCSIDRFNGHINNWYDLNICKHWGPADFSQTDEYLRGITEIEPVSVELYKTMAQGNHGDTILSLLVGRGEGFPYGICPNAEVVLIHEWLDWKETVSALNVALGFNETGSDFVPLNLPNKKCNAVTMSHGDVPDQLDTKTLQNMRRFLGEFGLDNLVIFAAGNSGYGLEWLHNSATKISICCGNYGDKGTTNLDKTSNTIFCANLLSSTELAPSSENSKDISYSPYITNFVPEKDYISFYGDSVLCKPVVINDTIVQKTSWASGTSFSTPCCSGILGLMRIIYSKNNPDCTCFGKNSEFMNYVKKNWMNPLPQIMTFAAGMGMPTFLMDSREIPLEALPPRAVENTFILRSPVGKKLSLNALLQTNDEQKPGYFLDNNANQIAKTKDGCYIPLKEGEANIDCYTLSSAEKADKTKSYNTAKLKWFIEPQEKNMALSKDSRVGFKLIEDSANKLFSVFGNSCLASDSSDSEEFSALMKVSISNIIDESKLSSNGTNRLKSIMVLFHDDTEELDISNPSLDVQEKIGLYHLFRLSRITTSESDPIAKTLQSTSGTRLDWGAKNSNGPTYRSVGKKASQLHLDKDDVAVLALVCNKNWTRGYYNGTEVFAVPNWGFKPLLSNLGLDFRCLNSYTGTNDSQAMESYKDECVIYSRALSQEEVVSSAIAMLK